MLLSAPALSHRQPDGKRGRGRLKSRCSRRICLHLRYGKRTAFRFTVQKPVPSQTSRPSRLRLAPPRQDIFNCNATKGKICTL
ncbi:hypothetical protein [Kingella potus]|uniref:hypothetical protein n=1 Tax=Kingella potus TaxID=265175 RepID=UPI001FD3A784|nr:hypothetical protein [Kingella potus]UOP00578.1 hypothetical protein LVJ84_12185 [Kingella potus]